MTLAPIFPLVSAAAPAAGAVASQAIGAIERLVDKISFRGLLDRDDEAMGAPANDARSTVESPQPPDHSESLLALPNRLQAALKSLGEIVSGKLAKAGVDLTHAVEFESDNAGGARVADGHPQQRAIEQALNSDPAAAGAIGELLERVRRDRELTDQAAYLELHAVNPQLAASQFPAMAAGPDAPDGRSVRLRLVGGNFSPLADR